MMSGFASYTVIPSQGQGLLMQGTEFILPQTEPECLAFPRCYMSPTGLALLSDYKYESLI